jgi:ParB/RepB/Spo0J family partition protein
MADVLATPKVDIGLIDVVDNFNARQKFPKEELEQLAGTIKETGLVQPIKVKKKPGGRFDLVAGERRFRAAKLAGLKEIEITLSTGNPVTETLVENIHRSNLDPIETALGLKAFAEEHNLATNKKIAIKARKREGWVGAHMRLLKLPKSVQRYIAAGEVPADAEPLLRPIAEVSPKVAAIVCEAGKQRGLSGRQFIERFGDLFEEVPRMEGLKNVPTMIRMPRFQLSEVIPDLDRANKDHKELIDKILAAFYGPGHYYGADRDPQVQLAEPEIDRARAAGVLVEHVEGRYSRAYAVDRELALDLVHSAIERRVKEREEEEKQEAVRQEELKAQRKEDREKAKQERNANGQLTPQAQAKADAEYALRYNEALGGTLLERRSGGKRKKHALARAKLVAHLFIDKNEDLAGRGLRFTIDKLRQVERTPLKKGGFKEKVTYATDEECTVELRRRIDNARSETEVNEVLTEAIFAAVLADSKAEPQSRRPYWTGSIEATRRVEKIAKAELNEVKPRRPRRVQQKKATQ